MNMNRLSILLASCASIWTISTSGQTTYEYGDVIETRPIYQIVEISEPMEQCREEVVIDRYPSRSGSRTPVLVSTIIGGALGNAVGNGKSNKRIGAVVGAMLGHSIGRDIVTDRNRSRNAVRVYETVQRCETAYEKFEEERLVGYQVTYLYNGEEYSVRTDSDPGEQIRLRVSIQPAN
ncbi:MAG TPA: hypothetical protein DEP13_06715 [Gammaproteobacteria bacterium]|nr:hypothetical protein [Gammaproteobacteria bacterium]